MKEFFFGSYPNNLLSFWFIFLGTVFYITYLQEREKPKNIGWFRRCLRILGTSIICTIIVPGSFLAAKIALTKKNPEIEYIPRGNDSPEISATQYTEVDGIARCPTELSSLVLLLSSKGITVDEYNKIHAQYQEHIRKIAKQRLETYLSEEYKLKVKM